MFAIVGLGKMGRFYDGLLKARYVVDSLPLKGRIAFSNVDEFIAYRQPVDLVIVASPTVTHYPIVKSLLTANYNVLVEKPICLAASLAAELEEIALERKLVLYQSTLERYNPLIKFLKNNIQPSQIDRVESFRFGAQPPSAHIDDAKFDLGIHDVDLWFHLFRREVPWTVEVGYGETRRELVVHLKDGNKVVCDLLNRFISINGYSLDFSRASNNNQILEMLYDLIYRRSAMNERWSREIKILEESSSSRIVLN